MKHLRILRKSVIHCDFEDEKTNCENEADYIYNKKYVCHECLVSVLSIEVEKQNNTIQDLTSALHHEKHGR